MKMKVGATALLMSLMTIDQAFAGYWRIVPTPVPEFDGSGSTAVIALLASVAVIIFRKSRSN